jgi:soluble lytic murein transglycosylase-like protein
LSFVFARQAAFLAVAMFISGLIAQPAKAQVLEIGADGAVTRFEGPAVFTDDGARALIQDAPLADLSIGADAVRQQISTAASAYALDPKLVEAVAWRESRFHAGALSAKGAIGVMQLMPGTARDLGVDPHDPVQNIRGGALYLRRMMSAFGGDVRLALAAYNAGPAAVRKHGGVPPYAETQAYVTSILGRMAATGAVLAVPVLGASQ